MYENERNVLFITGATVGKTSYGILRDDQQYP